MNNSQSEIKSDKFMDNAYEQINKDISNILSELRQEEQKDNKDNLNNKFFDNNNDDGLFDSDLLKKKYNPNYNFFDIKKHNDFNNNNRSINNKILGYNNAILNNNGIINKINNYPVNNFINNLHLSNIIIINKSNNEYNDSFLKQTVTERGVPGLYNKDIANNIINIDNIVNNKDKRTTLIIRNIPNKYTISLLLMELNINFKNKFDVIYLPQDKINNTNLGYGFINFINPLHLNEKIRKSLYINNIKNIKVPLEIPKRFLIKFKNYHPKSLYYKKNDKVFIVETFYK